MRMTRATAVGDDYARVFAHSRGVVARRKSRHSKAVRSGALDCLRRDVVAGGDVRHRPVHHHLLADVHRPRSERIRALHRVVLEVARHRADLQGRASFAQQPDLADVRRGLLGAREAPFRSRAEGRSRRQPREHRTRLAPRSDRRSDAARVDDAVPRDDRFGRAVHRPVRHGRRHLVRVPRHRRFEGSVGRVAEDRRTAHRRGTVRDRGRSRRRDPRRHGVQLLPASYQGPALRDGDVRAGLPQHHQAPLPEVAMAFKSGGGDELNAEINVTPMVDVMLVLLIIFMITAPMMNTGVSLELPQVTAQNVEDPEGKLVLSIAKDDKIFLGGTQVLWHDLEAKLKSNERVKKESALYIEADTNLLYGRVVTAMAIAKRAGGTRVMMLTAPSDVLNVEQLDKNIIPAAPSK